MKLCAHCKNPIPRGINYARNKYCCHKCSADATRFDDAKRMEVFMSRVVKSESGCWLYQGARDKWGHAHVGIGERRHSAHRYFYSRLVEPIPAGKQVLHRCNVPHCVNPAHLYLGTDKENTADKLAVKGQAWGERNSSAKLKAEEVRAIRVEYRYEDRRSNARELADKYGVCQAAITAIIARRTWANLD